MGVQGCGQPLLRQARLAGQGGHPDIDQTGDLMELQRGHRLLDIATLVPDADHRTRHPASPDKSRTGGVTTRVPAVTRCAEYDAVNERARAASITPKICGGPPGSIAYVPGAAVLPNLST